MSKDNLKKAFLGLNFGKKKKKKTKADLEKSGIFIQSDTLATNATEDSTMSADENLPSTQLELIKERQKEDELAKEKRYKNILGTTLLGLGILNELIPDNLDQTKIVTPQDTYNPNMYGTGSQAIYKKGGELSAAKAKEMLKDGTAHGKKLTKKQKRYFGMVAAGKAAFGLEVPGEDDPKDPNYQKRLAVANQFAKDFARRRGHINAEETFVESPDTSFVGLDNKPFQPLPTNRKKVYKLPVGITLNDIKSYGDEHWYEDPQTGDAVYVDNSVLSKFSSTQPQIQNALASRGQFEDGGEMFGEGSTSELFEFKGPSHENGGIPITYQGQTAEVEGGETAFIDNEGDLNILGNMYVPGTKKKFKQVGKELAKEEEKNTKILDKGLNLVKLFEDPSDKMDKLSFNTGKVMLQGGLMEKNNIDRKKENLANLQQAMLQGMNQGYAAKGAVVGDDDPKKKKQSMAVRMNNPGNIKFGAFAKKYGAVQGDPATDGGFFAKFPDTQTGLTALTSLLKTKNYKDLSVDAAIKRWTNNTGYAVDYKGIANKKISELGPDEFKKLVDIITVGEDGKYYTPKNPQTLTPPPASPKEDVPVPPFSPYELPNTPKNQEVPKAPVEPFTYVPNTYDFTQRPAKNPAPIQSPLEAEQLAGEIYTLATNQVEPVDAQFYRPQLFEPYSVSFQDRLNMNQSTFNATQRVVGNNPEALSVLAGQKYAADNQVLGEEFRINQQIANDVTNKNIGLLNDSQLKNLGIADTQMVRQSTARSKTKAQTQLALQSIGDKTLKNRYENLDSSFKQMLFKYRPVDKDNDGLLETLEYQGDAPTFYSGTPGTQPNQEAIRTRTEYDGEGRTRKVTKTEPSLLEQEKMKTQARKAFFERMANPFTLMNQNRKSR